MVDIAEAATRRIGPLPAWAWGGVIGAGFVVYRAVSGGGGGASSPFVQPVSGGEPFDFGDGGGGGSGSGSAPTPTPQPTGPAFGLPAGVDLDKYVNALRLQFPETRANYVKAFGTWQDYIGETAAERTERLTQEIRFYQQYGQENESIPTVTVPTSSPTPSPTLTTTRAAIERTATGDTSAMQPPIFGLGIERAQAIMATQVKMAATYREPGPSTPRIAREIPGVAPSLPPVLRTQGDTRAIGDTGSMLNPRNLALATRTRLRGTLPPTTTMHRIRVPASLTAAAQRIRPTRAG